MAVGMVRGFCADDPAAAGAAMAASSSASTNVLSSSSVGPLLDLFVKKGFVTQEEADQVKAEAETAQTNQQAIERSLSKWKINDDLGIKSVELFGDLRLRYESR